MSEELIGAATPAKAGEEIDSADIRDTDIVFDCPACGHNLCVDYRAAGLQIDCVECGERILVPIPDGMNIEDLDIEKGEVLKQLFATRRLLQKAERRVAQLENKLTEIAVALGNVSALVTAE